MTAPQMTVLQQYIHTSRYARWLPEKGRREIWDETVDRYVDFFESHIEENTKGSIKSIKTQLRDAIYNMEDMPSMSAAGTTRSGGSPWVRTRISWVGPSRLRSTEPSTPWAPASRIRMVASKPAFLTAS